MKFQTYTSTFSCWFPIRPYLASRLGFDCTPTGKFLGLDVKWKRVSFTENVFYEFRERKDCASVVGYR